jgi:hypothetical protein
MVRSFGNYLETCSPRSYDISDFKVAKFNVCYINKSTAFVRPMAFIWADGGQSGVMRGDASRNKPID